METSDFYMVNRAAIRKRTAIAVIIGAIIGFLVNLNASVPDRAYPPVEEHGRMMRACKLPDIDGAMTVFVMEDGKLKCWRWK